MSVFLKSCTLKYLGVKCHGDFNWLDKYRTNKKKGINKYWQKANKAKKQISIVNPAGWQTGVQCTISTLPYFEISTVKSWHNYSENR